MTTLTRRFPRPEFNLLRREMDRLFTDFQSEGTSHNNDSLVWMPRADLSETEESFVLSLDLPGVTPEDVDVTLEDDKLTISGRRQPSTQQSEGRFHRVERTFGRFLRNIQFSVLVNADAIDASFEHGVLQLVVPKAETSKPKRIEVRSATRREVTSGDGSSTDESAIDVDVTETA